MIRLIASDMDGTLLGTKMEVLEENVKAIRFAEKQGITFMAATGRGITEAIPPLKEAGLHCPLITVNGAQAFDEHHQEIFTIDIPNQISKQIMDIFYHHGVYFEVATTQGVFSNSRPRRIENIAMMLANKIPHLTFKMAIAMASAYLDLLAVNYIEDYHKLLDHPDIQILKFITMSQEAGAVLNPVREDLTKLAQTEDIVITSSSPTNIEVNHKNAQKGIAVKHVAEKMGIPLDQVMTIGDNFNDISMLQVAGVSFAMGNAEEEVKKQAKYITTDHTEAGVAKAIYRAIEENL